MSDTMAATTNTPTPAVPVPLQTKFHDLGDAMGLRLVERSKEIDTLRLAILSRTHHLQVGPPGIAKSMLVRTLVQCVEDLPTHAYFETLLTPFSTPNELFGIPNLKRMETDGVYERQLEGTFASAVWAFLDEIFKANSAILNGTLSVINERIYHNNGPKSVPLCSLFSGSNEFPRGEELEAMFDRLHFRHVVKPISEPGNFIRMLTVQSLPPVTPVISWTDIQAAQMEVDQVTVPNDVLDAINGLRGDLRAKGIEPTDRRFAECIKIIRASAWLRGEVTADIVDMHPLAHVLWQTPDDMSDVTRIVMELANPLDGAATKLLDEVEALAVQLEDAIKNSDTKQALTQRAVPIYKKMERAEEELNVLMTENAKAGRPSPTMEQCKSRLRSMTGLFLKDVLSFNKAQIAAHHNAKP